MALFSVDSARLQAFTVLDSAIASQQDSSSFCVTRDPVGVINKAQRHMTVGVIISPVKAHLSQRRAHNIESERTTNFCCLAINPTLEW